MAVAAKVSTSGSRRSGTSIAAKPVPASVATTTTPAANTASPVVPAATPVVPPAVQSVVTPVPSMIATVAQAPITVAPMPTIPKIVDSGVAAGVTSTAGAINYPGQGQDPNQTHLPTAAAPDPVYVPPLAPLPTVATPPAETYSTSTVHTANLDNGVNPGDFDTSGGTQVIPTQVATDSGPTVGAPSTDGAPLTGATASGTISPNVMYIAMALFVVWLVMK